MDPKRQKSISKFLSLILRHQPELVGIELDESGWTPVDELLRKVRAKGKDWTREMLELVVAENPKKRFSFSEDGTRIRANQGHSVPVSLGYQATTPPAFLFHGTVAKYLDSIRESGLVPGSRHHVHLSPDKETARIVGMRRGKPLILIVRAQEMADEGHEFFLSENGVWLSDHVPVQFLQFPD